MADSSTAETPDRITASTGIRSPGLTRIRSPTLTWSMGTSLSPLSVVTVAVRGEMHTRDLMALRADSLVACSISPPRVITKLTTAAVRNSPWIRLAAMARLTSSSTLISRCTRPLTAPQIMGAPLRLTERRASTLPARLAEASPWSTIKLDRANRAPAMVRYRSLCLSNSWYTPNLEKRPIMENPIC